jgi:hypothetical protein
MPYYPPRSIGGVTLPLDHTDLGDLINVGTNTHAVIDAHLASTANPHAVTAAQAGADPVGTAAAAVAAHVGLPDPHTQYALDTDLAAYVLKSLYAVKGDVLFASGASTPVALSVGSDGDVLTADSAQPLGVKWTAAGAGSTNIKQTEIDFGATPLNENTFTVVDAGVSALSQLIAQIAFEQPTGKDLDEVELETFEVKCTPAAGSFNVLVRSLEGRVQDKYKLNYLIG